jgi:hypothetical protein
MWAGSGTGTAVAPLLSRLARPPYGEVATTISNRVVGGHHRPLHFSQLGIGKPSDGFAIQEKLLDVPLLFFHVVLLVDDGQDAAGIGVSIPVDW